MNTSMFIERLDGKIMNISLLQTLCIDPNDSTDVLWYFKNGEVYREDLASAEEANNRLKDLKGILLGSTVAELQTRINEQQNTIVQQTKTIQLKEAKISEIENKVDLATISAININGEEATNG